MLDVVHTQNTNLLEGPAGESLGKFTVLSLDLAAFWARDLGIQPFVLQHLGGPNNRDSSRVSCLENRHQGKLLARGEEIFGVHGLGLLLGVVAVRGRRGTDHGRQERARPKRVSSTVGEGQDTRDLEVILKARSHVGGRIEHQDVVGLGGGESVVVEVVDDSAGAFSGKCNVNLGQEGSQ